MYVLGFLLMSAVYVVAASDICPDGFGHWYHDGGEGGSGPSKPSCYKFVRKDFQWGQGRRNCISLGGDLVTIETEGENSHLTEQIQSFPLLQHPELTDYRDWGYWTGGNDQLIEGDWRWAASNSKFSYSAWTLGPMGVPMTWKENCLQLSRRKDWKWNALSCGDLYQGSICEIKGNF